jgi:hypothetical protein
MHIEAKLATRCKTNVTIKNNKQQNSKIKDQKGYQQSKSP